MPDGEEFRLRAAPSDEGTRLDVFLGTRLAGCSRSQAALLISGEQVYVNGVLRKAGHRLKAGDVVSGTQPAPEPLDYRPEPIPLDILFEDDQIIVLNKPPGLVVHPSPGHDSGTLVNALLHHCSDLTGIGGCLRPGIVHRLDKDTSGTMVVAKTAPAHERLSRQFKQRRVQKQYLALVHGTMPAPEGVIRLPIGRHPTDRKRMATVSRKPREAETRWRVREVFEGLSLIEVSLMTGRTHQIRVHCAAVRHPVVGDPVYGSRHRRRQAGRSGLSNETAAILAGVSRQMLHAWQLAFFHPSSGKPLLFESALPQDMQRVLTALGSEIADHALMIR